MEHESFENEEIAQVMNEHFVCIKVDREERPDVDQIYMNAVHLMRGQGGWPLNCFALPDGRPVFGATYFPPQQWKNTLLSLEQNYRLNSAKFEEYANNLLQGISQSEVVHIPSEPSPFKETQLHEIFQNIAKTFDHKEGGFGQSPKFPLPTGLEFCLAYGHEYQNKKALDFVHLTLSKMAKGGIYDQLGGGFARYSVDDVWKVPHFEKMLYDNGQLISLYSKAYQINKDPLYKKVIEQTLVFVKRDMTQEETGFYAAFDADSEGVEGKFYVWTKDEIKSILKQDAEIFCDTYGITDTGNWEAGKNIPLLKSNGKTLAEKYHITEDEVKRKINNCSQQLLEEREKRVKPGLDDKILCSWNALMQQGYIDAYLALGNHEYLEIAENNALFIWKKLGDGQGKLLRTYKNGHAKIEAFLDDYAFTIKAFLSLYQITFNQEYLHKAELLLTYCDEHFLNTSSKMYYYTAQGSSLLVARKMELSDNVIPASNSVMAQNLMLISSILSSDKKEKQALLMLYNIRKNLKTGQVYYANWDVLMMKFLRSPKEVVIMGSQCPKLGKEIQRGYHFNTVFVGSEKDEYLTLMRDRFQDNKSSIYICKSKTCQMPVYTSAEALQLLREDE